MTAMLFAGALAGSCTQKTADTVDYNLKAEGTLSAESPWFRQTTFKIFLRIRLVGINLLFAAAEDGISTDILLAVVKADAIARAYAAQVNPLRMFLPAGAWDGNTSTLFLPRESSSNRVAMVLASDVPAVPGGFPAETEGRKRRDRRGVDQPSFYRLHVCLNILA